MKTHIIIHSTCTPEDQPLTYDDILDINSADRHADPMPYHYIIDLDGRIIKGKRDFEHCSHCGRFSRDTYSIAVMGGINSDTNEPADTMNPSQESALVQLLNQLRKRYPNIPVTGANSLLHPDEDPTSNEPFFDVQQWLTANSQWPMANG